MIEKLQGALAASLLVAATVVTENPAVAQQPAAAAPAASATKASPAGFSFGCRACAIGKFGEPVSPVI